MNTGRCYEDFTVGDVYQHPVGRTVTETDNVWFTLLTVNNNPIHFDKHYAAQTEWGRPLVDSTFTLALVTGLSVSDMSQYAVNLGWDAVRLPAPVFEGDTIYAQSEVISMRRVTVASAHGHRSIQNRWLQSGWRGRNRVPTHDHGLQARLFAAAPSTKTTAMIQ